MHGRTCFSVGGDRLVRRATCDEAMSEIQLKGKHSASCVFFSPLFLPTFVASL